MILGSVTTQLSTLRWTDVSPPLPIRCMPISGRAGVSLSLSSLVPLCLERTGGDSLSHTCCSVLHAMHCPLCSSSYRCLSFPCLLRAAQGRFGCSIIGALRRTLPLLLFFSLSCAHIGRAGRVQHLQTPWHLLLHFSRTQSNNSHVRDWGRAREVRRRQRVTTSFSPFFFRCAFGCL